MSNTISYIFIGVFAVVLIAVLIVMRFSKKYKEKANQIKQSAKELSDTLGITEQHLKYKKRIKMLDYLVLVYYVLIALCLTFFIFLPIFQIKCELEGIELFTKKFSVLENFISLKNAVDKNARNFADANYTAQIIPFIIFAGFLLCAVIDVRNKLKPDTDGNSTKTFFINSKLKVMSGKSIYWTNVTILFILCVICQIYLIMFYKKATFNFSSDSPYTITDMGRYLIYSDADGFILRVFQNDFKLCNGVSSVIALPLICFILAIVVLTVYLVLKKKLINEIREEEIATPEKEQTTT